MKPKSDWTVREALDLANTLANHGWTREANSDAASSCIYALCRMLKGHGNAAAMRTGETNETTTDISAEIGEMSDYCHNNTGSKTWEDWEKMHEWLLDIRRRIETAVLSKAIELSKRFVPGNAAAMREALEFCIQQMSDAICDKDFGDDVEYLVGCMKTCIDFMKHALAAPPRNCDRPECATSTAAQDVWRKENGGKTPYYEWLLAPAAERKGADDEQK